MTAICRDIANSPSFQHFITAVILLAGIVVGVETSAAAVERWGSTLHLANQVVLWIFVAEAAIKIGAEGARPWRYFADPWNLFDFVIVAVCFLPLDAQYVAVLRLARLLRVLKLVRALPQLQIIVSTLLKSIPSMGYVAVLLFLLFYVYAVAGVFLFGGNDPVHFATLPVAMLSLFRVVTGDAWTDIMYIQMFGCDRFGYGDREALCTAPSALPVFGALYFVSFVLVGAMVILNLFIGVIMAGMEEAKNENQYEARKAARAADREPTVSEDLDGVLERVAAVQAELESLKVRIAHEGRAAGE